MTKQEGRDIAASLGTRFTFVGFTEEGNIIIMEMIPHPNRPYWHSSNINNAGFKEYTFTPDDVESGSHLIMLQYEMTRDTQ